jgi:deoxyuridine 5'-triphosphate nucleotidohydrolase
LAADGDELVKHFMRAYIERHGTIAGSYLHLTLCNTEEDNVGKIRNLYKIPCTLTNYNATTTLSYSRLIYCDANMIDFLGIFYSDPDILYVSKKMYDFTDGGCGGCGSDGDLEKYCSYSEATTPTIKVLKDDESAVMPSKASYSDAGYDLTIIKEHKVLNSDTKLYDTGIKLDIPNGYYVEIVPRSSISRSGYMLANNVGIIDQGYRGNLYIALRKVNKDCEDLVLPWKCCQFIVKKQVFSRLKLSTEDLTKTRRDCGGFGSSDLVPINIQKVLLYNNA